MQAQHPLERLRELVAAAADARRPTSYARRFGDFSATHHIKQKMLEAYERDLLALDVESWRMLKAAAIKRLIHNKKRGWEPLFGILNEAKAFTYLRALGCTDIQIIPHSYAHKTPDLRAELRGTLVLCEVKTIHMSDDARMICAAHSAPQSRRCLSEQFLHRKLTAALRAAKAQLDAFPSRAARKLAYVVLNPEESLNEYDDDYAPQLKAFLKEFPLEGVEVEVFQIPPVPKYEG